MPLRTVIVEDEPHSLSRLKSLLQDIAEVELIGEAENGEDAIRQIDSLKPDLVLLDIQLPGMTGFDVLARSAHRPAVIFITAYDQYAVKAFEENAIDYLLKPTAKERLQKAVTRIVGLRQPPERNLLETLQHVIARSRPVRVFTVKHQEDILLIPESEVCYFKAEDKYVFLYTAERAYFYEGTLKELESELNPDRFIRIHKSYIVALAKVKKLQKWFLNDFILELKDSAHTRLRIGRSYLPALKEKLKF